MTVSRQARFDERARRLLKTLVELYIREGQPVGSALLARESGLDISSATVRNVMADLERLGLVRAPHTSAGRVPTVQGYRLFIDTLLEVHPLEEAAVAQLQRALDAAANSGQSLLQTATALLSELTQLAGLVVVPRRAERTVRHIEFLPISERRVLVVLVFSEREVENRLIETDRPYDAATLQQAANYLNQHFFGQDLASMRARLQHELDQTRAALDAMLQALLDVAGKVFDAGGEWDAQQLLVEGQTNLMRFEDLSDVEKLRRLFEALRRKQELLDLLERCQRSEGVKIFIGQESGYAPLDECSLVASPYRVGGQVVGVLGVIGPTRIPYERVIPVVDVTARLLGAALQSEDEPPPVAH
ncbi:MAG: heat-inducible transcription repressor HrcA [Gammaproteobacteria bacterium]|nr:MAG: heat-inducible transcription repressor HrcA [Gammaproteobacteria bacterium]